MPKRKDYTGPTFGLLVDTTMENNAVERRPAECTALAARFKASGMAIIGTVPCVITFALIAAKAVTVGGKVLKARG